MSVPAILTLRGMVSYKPDLFDLLVLPTAPDANELGVESTQVRAAWTINKADFVDFLCFYTEGMSLAIPDYPYLKKAIGTWSNAHLHEWQRMFDTLFYKYNPLWNKDFKITEHEETRNDKDVTGRYQNESVNNAKATDYTNGYDGGTSTEQDPMMSDPHSIKWTHSDASIGHNTGLLTNTHSDTTDDDTDRDLMRTEKGNIGVTMVQDMIAQERELALYSIEEYLAERFKENFCLMLW